MSGHSKWSTIKRQKAVTDSRRSAVFTKLGRLVTVAAREGGGDPAMNFKLRLAIDKAKAANVPNDNIDRAIKAGTGELRGDQTKEVLYEGFGPGRVAILVEAITDNPNRTAADMRQLFQKHGGSLGSMNTVAWMFTRKGVLRVPLSLITDRDNFLLEAIDIGVDDTQESDDQLVLYCPLEQMRQVQDWLMKSGKTPTSVGPEFVAGTSITIDETAEAQLFALFEELEEHPDVTNFFSNDA